MDFYQGLSSVVHLSQVVWTLTQYASNLLISVIPALQVKCRALYSSHFPLVRTCRGILLHNSSFLSFHPGKDMGYRITKKCSADCPETNTDFGVVAISTKCCKTSLCNFSGANSVKLSYAVMFLGTVASLICVIRAGLWWGLRVGEDVMTQGHMLLPNRLNNIFCQMSPSRSMLFCFFFQHFFFRSDPQTGMAV